MKKSVHVFFLFLLLAFLTVPSVWAATDSVSVTENGQAVYFPGKDTVFVDVGYSVTSFRIPEMRNNYCASCTGIMRISIRPGYAIAFDGTVTLAQGTRLVVYDGYSTYAAAPKIYDWTNPYASIQENIHLIASEDYAEIQIVNTYGSNNKNAKVNLTVTVKPTYRVTTSRVPYNTNVVYKPYSTEFMSDFLGYGMTVPEGVWVYLFTKDSLGYTTRLKVRRKDDSTLVRTSSDEGRLRFRMPAGDVDVEYRSFSSLSGLDYIDMLCMDRSINLSSKDKSFKIYDNGGDSDNYTDSCNASLNLIAPEGYHLKLTGTVTTESASNEPFDYLEINYGSTNKRVFSTSTNMSVSVGDITNAGRNMTLKFHSDASVKASGLDLTAGVVGDPHSVKVTSVSNGSVAPSSSIEATGADVVLTAKPNSGYVLKSVRVKNPSGDTVRATSSWQTNKIEFTMPNSNVTVTPTFAPDTYRINPVTTTGGTLAVASSAKLNSTVTITATPASGYMLKDIEVKDADSNIVNLVKKNFTSMSFTMPMNEVKVTPIWTKDWSAAGGLYVNMSKDKKDILTIPAGIKSFRIYEDKYLRTKSDTLVLKAPTGYVLQLTGDMTYGGYKNDSLLVYSGSVIRADSLLRKNGAYKVQSKGETMMVLFGGNGDSGLDLAVNVVKAELEQGKDGDSVYVNMFFQRKMTFEIPSTLKSFKVYDDGGKDGNYSANNMDTLVLKAPAGHVLRLSGGVNTNDGGSYSNAVLSVYSGAETNADSLLGSYRSTNGRDTSISGNVLSRGDYMTLWFYTDKYNNRNPGLDLTVEVIPLVNSITYRNNNSGGSVTSDAPKTGKRDSIVNYAYSYSRGYIVKEIKAVSADGDSVSVFGGWYNDKKASFKMPLGAVTVTSTYTNNLSAAGGLYVNMRKTKKDTAIIPEDVKSFKVYDNGGKNGNYSSNSSDTLVLNAPSGYVLRLSGSVTTYHSYDRLRVYSGSVAHSDSLLGEYYSSTAGKAVSVSGSVLSSGVNMTLLFYSGNYFDRGSGLDLMVELVPVDYTVTVANAAGGSLADDVPETANVGDEIALTAMPMNSDYMLVSFGVKDAAGNDVPVIRNTLTTGKFKMPAGNVTITPVFADTRSTYITAAGGFHLDMTSNRKVEFDFPVTVKSFNLYDHGGKTGDYIESSDDTLVFTAPVGYHFEVAGSIYTERNYDFLYVYDGQIKTENELFKHSSAEHGARYDVGTVKTTSNSMTIYFHSDGSRTYAGLDLTVTLVQNKYTVTINSSTGGSLYGQNADTLGAVVVLTGLPTSSYHLSDITVVDQGEKVVKSPIYSFDRSKFIMPANDVTVTPTWTNNLTAEGGLHLELLKNGKVNATIPAGVKSFNLYDNGGEGEAYESNSNDTLTLNAPVGYHLIVTGSVALETRYDSLYIYDGNNTSATKLFGGSSATNGSTSAIDTITSSGESLTFRFKSDDRTNYSGLNLKVSVEQIVYDITIADVVNGSVSSDKTKAVRGAVVDLYWTYTAGYMIRDIDVRDTSNNKVVVNGGWYSGAKASFVMPGSAVTVIPSFTNNKTATGDGGLYINMPKTGTINASIPAEVKSFKVFDDGGKDREYSNYANGTLVLTAPEGYALELSGNVVAETPYSETTIYDYLNVYDGADQTANVLLGQATGTVNVASVRSSGRNMTLYFYSDGITVKDGLDLTVKVLKPVHLLTIADIPQQSYTGDSIKPTPIIKDGARTLVENTDYTLSYSSNTNSGEASVTIRGMGDYIGSTTLTFTIGPKVTRYAAINILEDQRGKGVAVNGNYNGDDTVMITDSIQVDFVEYGRKFSTSGFSTIVLPFDVNTSNVSGLKKVAAFSEIRTNEAGRLVAVMSLVWKDSVGVPDTTLKANTPYMVLMNGTNFAVDGGVTLVPTVEPVVRSGDWEFRGTLAKRVWADGDTALGRVYGFSAEERPEQNIKIGQFVKAGAGAWIRPGRAYLINVPETQGNHVGAGRPAIAALPSVVLPEDMDVVIEDKEDGSTTFVGRFNARTGEFINMKSRTYDLKGRNVNGSRAKGMFIRK